MAAKSFEDKMKELEGLIENWKAALYLLRRW